MPILYKPSKYAFLTDGEILTEQEHKDSCDVNKMLAQAKRGYQIRGSNTSPIYGYDDTTMDAVTHRIQKQKLEEELIKISKTSEFTEEELKSIPESIKNKFKFKTKQKAKNDELNDEKTPNKQKLNKDSNQSSSNQHPKKGPLPIAKHGGPASSSHQADNSSFEAEGDA